MDTICGQSKYRWPLLSLFRVSPSPGSNPGNFSAQRATEIDGGLVEWQVRDGGPELKLVSMTAALMAIVASGVYVDRERSRAPRVGRVHRTTPVPLSPGARSGLEVEQFQHSLHRVQNGCNP